MTSELGQNGDKVEFMRRYSDVAGRIFAFIFALVHDHDAARDIFQETNVALWETFDQYDLTREFYPWARQIAYHRVLQHRQRRQRDSLFLSDVVLDELAAEADAMSFGASDRQRALAECCEKLTAKDRELLDRRYAAGARVETVAAGLNLSLHQVYRSLRRIHLRLQNCVRRALAEGGG